MGELSLATLCYTDFDFRITDIFAESWTRGKEFSLYKRKPRPVSALFFICSDHTVVFTPQDGAPPLTVQRGDVVYIPQGVLYEAKIEKNKDIPAVTYTVNLHFSDKDRNDLLLSPCISVLSHCYENHHEASLKRLCDAFHHAVSTPAGSVRSLARVKGEFYLLLDAIGTSKAPNDDAYYPIRRGVDAFCAEWNQNERIEKYAQLSEVSVTYFYRCFRKWSGKSPIEYRTMLRLSNAETLLRCTDMQIQEIAQAVGFDDPFYFCRSFSARYGASPQLYRKQHQDA